MDKGSEYLGKGRSNGTKSPSNASNGHFSDESGSDDDHGIASNTYFQHQCFKQVLLGLRSFISNQARYVCCWHNAYT